MPYIHVTTNLTVPEAAGEAIKRQLGHAVTALRGKSEDFLMVRLEDDARLWMAGTDDPAALVAVSVYGGAPGEDYDNLTGRITEILEGALGLSPQRVYVKYAETEYWGWNGRNF